jgi:hypothetical protein
MQDWNFIIAAIVRRALKDHRAGPAFDRQLAWELVRDQPPDRQRELLTDLFESEITRQRDLVSAEVALYPGPKR